MHIVICGGGVIGAATGYALSCHGADVTIVERWQVGGAASGKSGGFLAQDWCDGTPVEALARRSFALHRAWAEALGNSYGFRPVDTFAAAMSQRRTLGSGGGGSDDETAWLADSAAHRSRLGDHETTAQLDPEAFTKALVDAAIAKGAKLRNGVVTRVRQEDGAGTDVTLEDGSEIKADAVVLALGPWSLLAAQWVSLPPVYGVKGHSIVFEPREPLPAVALFAEFETMDGEVVAPEIVSRADGTVYVCGVPGSAALPLDPSRVTAEPDGCDRLRDVAVELVPQLACAEVVSKRACFRPTTADGLPLIGPVPDAAGIYVATGHSVWGMLNAPGTGEALAQLILDGSTTHVDLTPFAINRMPPYTPN